MKLSKDILTRLINVVTHTHEDEIGCGECFDKLHEFADLKLQGKSPEEAMPLVQEHIKRCHECREEYEALIEALKALKVAP